MMKNIYWLFIGSLIFSCTTADKNFVTLNGKLHTTNVEKITIHGRGYSKEIYVDSEGIFSDTINVIDGDHAIVIGNDRRGLFLKNGYNLNLEFKGENLSDGILFKGKGAETNNYMENKRYFFTSDDAVPESYFILEKEEYLNKVATAKALLKSYLDNTSNLDSVIYKRDMRNDSLFFNYIASQYEMTWRLKKGNVSPLFTDYENFNGSSTSLADLKGAYVYIDIWATWCAPCKVEIPHLKALEKEYQSKNIVFVSISVDSPNAYDSWKKMVEDMDLGGIQLYTEDGYESDFMVAYGIIGIPRFILIDPEGNIVNANAPRPSDPKLKELFEVSGI